MGAGTPFIHGIQQLVALVDRDNRPFGNQFQLLIGNDGGHFDDALLLRVQPRHFQVNPDQPLIVLCHSTSPAFAIGFGPVTATDEL